MVHYVPLSFILPLRPCIVMYSLTWFHWYPQIATILATLAINQRACDTSDCSAEFPSTGTLEKIRQNLVFVGIDWDLRARSLGLHGRQQNAEYSPWVKTIPISVSTSIEITHSIANSASPTAIGFEVLQNQTKQQDSKFFNVAPCSKAYSHNYSRHLLFISIHLNA